MTRSWLEDLVLAAFMRAEAEGRRDVAGHLLLALEALCPGPEPDSPLAEAYRAVVQKRPSSNRTGSGGPAISLPRRPGRKGPS